MFWIFELVRKNMVIIQMEMTAVFAYTKSLPLTLPALKAMSRHARRDDRISQLRRRPEAQAGAAMHWLFDDAAGLDYAGQLDALLSSRGASLRNGAPVAHHMLVGVSPEWIEETGRLHDARNPRNADLLSAAVGWSQLWSGQCVIAGRLDLDETGGAVADVIVAPIHEERHRSGSTRLVVSVNKSLEEISLRHTGSKGRHYSGLNSSWAEYAALVLDPRLRRGEPAPESGRRHIHPDILRRKMQREEEALSALLDAVKTGSLPLDGGRHRQTLAWQRLASALIKLGDSISKIRPAV